MQLRWASSRAKTCETSVVRDAHEWVMWNIYRTWRTWTCRSWRTWMSHVKHLSFVTHMNESCETSVVRDANEWDMWNICRSWRTWMRHVAYEYESRHLKMSHITYAWVVSPIHEWVMSPMNESCRLDSYAKRLPSTTHMSRHLSSVTHIKGIHESCHLWMSHVTYEWVMSPMNESCRQDSYAKRLPSTTQMSRHLSSV